jgi:hypothetical protein
MNHRGHLFRLRLLAVQIFLIFLFSNIFLIIPTGVRSATILPIATISLNEPSQTAAVGPDDDGLVEFSGTVSVEFNSATTVIVSLNAKDTWNSATVVPSALQFSVEDSGAKTFRVSVQAPLGTDSNVVGKLTVLGKWVMYPTSMTGECDPANGVEGTIYIEKYHQASYNVDDLQKTTDAGSSVQFRVFIQNTGNYDETYSFDIVNFDELNDKGIKVKFSANTIQVPRWGNLSFSVLVDTANGQRWEGVHNIQISISPEKVVKNGGQPYLIELKVVIDYKSGVEYFIDISPYIVILIIIVIVLVIIARWHKKRQQFLRELSEAYLKRYN